MADEQAVDATEDSARLDLHASAALPDADATEMPAAVDEHRVGLRLAVERGSARPEDERSTRRPRARKQADDVADVAWGDDRLRDQPVGTRVGGVPDQVGRPRVDLLLAERGDKLGLEVGGRPLGDPVGRAVGGGLADYSSHIPDATRA